MLYAQFYQPSTGYVPGTIPPRFNGPKEPIQACGTDSVIVLDARTKAMRWVETVRDECKKRGYIGYRFYQGERFSTATPVTDYWSLQ